VKRNVDRRIKIGSDRMIVNTSHWQHVLNLINYNKDGSLEVAHFTWVLLEEKMNKTRGGVDGIYLDFDDICLSDFLFAHIVNPCCPPALLRN
jgi:hypothetical protein